MPSAPPIAPASNIRSAQPIRMAIGVSDFAKLVRGGYIFVDKTLLIEEILQTGAEVTLIARPRRFGKTLNQSMLQHFFAEHVSGQPTRSLFDGLAIAGRPAAMEHQGQYPVIFLSFKDTKAESFHAFEDSMRELLAVLYNTYPQLADSPRLTARDRSTFDAVLNEKANQAKMANALRVLSELLYKHFGKKVIILLDEYDTPIHAAYAKGFYSQLVGFMRNMLGAALKDNPYLFKSVVTGILRVSKESLFSDLNNINVHTVLEEDYSAHFGFTQAEVSGLLRATGIASRLPSLEGQIKDWYNGYRFGAHVIYNPWSIVNCLDQDGVLKPYWIRTSGNDLLKDLMAQADAQFKEGLERLMQGATASEIVDPSLVFGDLDGGRRALWSLLLFSGYVTALSSEPAGTRIRCELAIPNREIRHLYEDIIAEWFTDTLQEAGYRNFLHSPANGDAAELEAVVREYLLRSASFFDVQGRDPEKFYHGLVLGMIVGLRDTHVIDSNRESAYGRYDVALFPKAGTGYEPGVILEFKQTRDAADLKATAQTALAQIDIRRYHTSMQQHPVRKILAVGMAFAGKQLEMASRYIDLG